MSLLYHFLRYAKKVSSTKHAVLLSLKISHEINIYVAHFSGDTEIREGPALKTVWPFRGFLAPQPCGLGFGPKIRKGEGSGLLGPCPGSATAFIYVHIQMCFQSKDRPSYRGLRPRYFFGTVCGSFNVPQIITVLWDGTLSEKTTKSIALHTSLQRQHFLLSPVEVWTRDPLHCT